MDKLLLLSVADLPAQAQSELFACCRYSKLSKDVRSNLASSLSDYCCTQALIAATSVAAVPGQPLIDALVGFVKRCEPSDDWRCTGDCLITSAGCDDLVPARMLAAMQGEALGFYSPAFKLPRYHSPGAHITFEFGHAVHFRASVLVADTVKIHDHQFAVQCGPSLIGPWHTVVGNTRPIRRSRIGKVSSATVTHSGRAAFKCWRYVLISSSAKPAGKKSDAEGDCELRCYGIQWFE